MAKDFNKALGRMIGIGGDYFIAASTSAGSGLLFSHVLITANAVLTDIKIAGTSVMTTRNYTGHTLPAGYLLCAGMDADDQDQTFNYVMLASGSAEGVIFYV
jgi:hypothetical protein